MSCCLGTNDTWFGNFIDKMRLRSSLKTDSLTRLLLAWVVVAAVLLVAADSVLAAGEIPICSASDVQASVDSTVTESGLQSVTVKTCFGTQTICVAAQDEIWVVSAEPSCVGCGQASSFKTEHLVGSQWRNENLADLSICHRQDPDHITVVVVHGNNTDHDWALTRGMQFYDRMFGEAPCNRPSIRLVIFAWDSEKVLARPGPDYKIKADRAVALGTGVVDLLDELGGRRPVMVGYSLGVQVVLSTLTELVDRAAGDSAQLEPRFHIALIAPALQSDFACNQLQSLTCNPLIHDAELFINRHDRVLLAARLLNRSKCENSDVEPSLAGLADQGCLDSRFRLNDVTAEVRNRHSLVNYIQSSTLQCGIRKLVADAEVYRDSEITGNAEFQPNHVAQEARFESPTKAVKVSSHR